MCDAGIHGIWCPVHTDALFLSLMKIIASDYMSIPILANSGLPDTFYKCLPYVITLIELAVSANKGGGPKAAGQPYDKGKR